MNERQRSVAGTLAIALIVATLFYVPWRVESRGNHAAANQSADSVTILFGAVRGSLAVAQSGLRR